MTQIQFKIRTKKRDGLTAIYVRVSNGRNNDTTIKTPFIINPKYWDAKHRKVIQKSGFDKED